MDLSEQALKFIFQKHKMEYIKKLGSGGFGAVYLVNSIGQEFLPLAVKCITKKQLIKHPSLEKYLTQEINSMHSLKHANIVRLVQTFVGNCSLIKRSPQFSSWWSTASSVIYFPTNIALLRKCLKLMKPAQSSFKFWMDSKPSTIKISFTEISNAKISSSRKSPSRRPTSAKLETSASPRNSAKLPSPIAELPTLWPLKS